jgi:hypothetical protein
LALGTFTAGVHVLSWQVCLLGVVMALAVPAIAWIEESALIFVLIAGAAGAIGIVFWWHYSGEYRLAFSKRFRATPGQMHVVNEQGDQRRDVLDPRSATLVRRRA